VRPVVHDAFVVVGHVFKLRLGGFSGEEIGLGAAAHVVPLDANVVVAIGTCVLVPEAERVQELVLDGAPFDAIRQLHKHFNPAHRVETNWCRTPLKNLTCKKCLH
jgi:hypothetical protein